MSSDTFHPGGPVLPGPTLILPLDEPVLTPRQVKERLAELNSIDTNEEEGDA